MKLRHYDDAVAVPSRCFYKCNVATAGNPFSDEKSARLEIKKACYDGAGGLNIVVYIRGGSVLNGTIIRAYVVDVS
jgi:hypothetical protein